MLFKKLQQSQIKKTTLSLSQKCHLHKPLVHLNRHRKKTINQINHHIETKINQIKLKRQTSLLSRGLAYCEE